MENENLKYIFHNDLNKNWFWKPPMSRSGACIHEDLKMLLSEVYLPAACFHIFHLGISEIQNINVTKKKYQYNRANN